MVSRRDVGAGLAAGGSGVLAAVLGNLWNFFQPFRARGFDAASIAEYRRGSEITALVVFASAEDSVLGKGL